MQNATSLPLLPGQLSPGVVVLVRVSSMNQIELFIYTKLIYKIAVLETI